jgi:rhodanese-related sulfurtransferase
MRSHTLRKSGAKADKAAVDFFRAKLEYEIGPYSLKAILDESLDDIVLVDCRGAESFDAGHIPTAMSTPFDELTGKLGTLPKDKTIVTYCGDITCPVSAKAALELAQKGFKVKHLVGGIAEWKNKGYSVESGPLIETERLM